MIKFFRRIRQSLLSENKFSKYLIYAIGEIVLVVIGILIALQINTWNENQKLKKEERQVLINFQQSLQNDLTNLGIRTQIHNRSDFSIGVILDHLENDKAYDGSLKVHFGQTNATPEIIINTSTFEALKSNNLNLISNENLRQSITDFYNYYLGEVTGANRRYSDIVEHASLNLYPSRFQSFWETNYEDWKDDWTRIESFMTPLNYEALKKDSEYLYHLRSLPNRRIFLARIHIDKITQEVNALLDQIDKELNSKTMI